MLKKRKLLSVILALFMLLTLLPANVFAQDNQGFMMVVNSKGYLETQGFNVFLYNTDYDRGFGDQKCAAMELILHERRIATNGNVTLLPTPEQWDVLPTPRIISRNQDRENNILTASLSMPDYNFNYTIKVEPEPGGVKVSLNLENPLPEILEGRAGFSLEFLPSIYIGKSYQMEGKDGTSYGVFPASPKGPMWALIRPYDDPAKQPSYVQEWNEARGPWQALPLAVGNSITMAPEDPLSSISITSDNGDLMLYDGRNRAQNGWFVLRTLIPSGKTEEAVVWHIRPNVIEGWTREPVIAHSQVGYAPNFSKVAIIELDPKFNAPKEAKVVRLEDDGTYTTVYEGEISEPVSWYRYNYAKFDFSSVKEPGMYAIEYAGYRSDLFPISRDAYSDIWQSSLDSFLAVEMDHMKVREGYRIWHGAAHMDDAIQVPPNTSYFDYAGNVGSNLDSPYEPYEHIPGLAVGGWFDAGDFDQQMLRIANVTQTLAMAAKEFDLNWDQLTVDWDNNFVEMHRPDGVPDIVQQTKHGILQILAQIEVFGHMIKSLSPSTLRQYTHLGDAASITDGKIYGIESNVRDDRLAVTTKSASEQNAAIAALAAASYALRGWYDDLADKCLDTAIELWNKEKSTDWNAAIELVIATNGEVEEYKNIVRQQLSRQQMGSNGWKAVRVLPYMDEDFRQQVESAVRSYASQLDSQLSSTPFGVPQTYGMWGGTTGVCDMGVRTYFLHREFPDIVSSEYTLRVANYILGTHPCSSTSWVSGIGTKSKLIAYGNNRADNSFIRGGIIPGYVIIQPDFPECIDDFGFLWFEHEYVIDTAASWIIVGNAVNEIVNKEHPVQTYEVTFNVTDGKNAIEKASVHVEGNVYPTDSDGETVLNLEPGEYRYSIMKDGYYIAAGNFEVTDKDTEVSVRLYRQSSEIPSVSSITLDGKPLANFSSNVTSYSVALPRSVKDAPKVEAVSAYDFMEVEITQAESIPGVATVKVTDGVRSTTYKISFGYGPVSEDFTDGEMDESVWTILNPDPENYSLEEGKGLRLPTLSGDIYGNGTSWKNVFVQQAAGDWDIVAKIYYPTAPSATYQQMALLVWQDADNYIKLDTEYSWMGGIMAQFGYESGGSFTGASSASLSNISPGSPDFTIYYRIKKTGNTYEGYYSFDGVEFTKLGTIQLELANTQIGLFATKNSNNATIDTYCQYIKVQ